jgi:hypothetical protein
MQEMRYIVFLEIVRRGGKTGMFDGDVSGHAVM